MNFESQLEQLQQSTVHLWFRKQEVYYKIGDSTMIQIVVTEMQEATSVAYNILQYHIFMEVFFWVQLQKAMRKHSSHATISDAALGWQMLQ